MLVDQQPIHSERALRPLTRLEDSLADRVFRTLKEAIVNKELPPGSRLSEAGLSKRLNVSKSPVREALLLLSQMGLVETVDRRMRVVMPSRRLIQDAYELRASLERTAVTNVTHRASQAERDNISRYAEASLQAARLGDRAGFREQDRLFHMALATANGNALLERALVGAVLLTAALRERDLPRPSDFVRCAEAHVRVDELIRRGESENAARAIESHVLDVMELVVEDLDADAPNAMPARDGG